MCARAGRSRSRRGALSRTAAFRVETRMQQPLQPGAQTEQQQAFDQQTRSAKGSRTYSPINSYINSYQVSEDFLWEIPNLTAH